MTTRKRTQRRHRRNLRRPRTPAGRKNSPTRPSTRTKHRSSGARPDQPTVPRREWLRRLDQAEIVGCWLGSEAAESCQTIGVGVRFGTDDEGTLLVSISTDTGELVSAAVSSSGYADVALRWATRDRGVDGLSTVSNRSAGLALDRALQAWAGGPLCPDCVAARVIIERVASLLADSASC